MTYFSWLSEVLAFGYVPSIFVAGRWLAINTFAQELRETNVLSRYALYGITGLLLWLPLLFALATIGRFSPPLIGALGWALCTFHFALKRDRPRVGNGNYLAAASALALFLLYATFSDESIQGGRDQGSYSLHAASIAQTGQLRAKLPTVAFTEAESDYRLLLPISNPRGFQYDLENEEMQAQFPPTLALSLAQFFGFGGLSALLSFNPFLATLCALVFYALARLYVERDWAVLGTIFFSLNPAQLWNAKITLSEIFAQACILAGLYLASKSCNKNQDGKYIVAIAILASSALARIDSFLLAVLVPASHLVAILLCQRKNTISLLVKVNKANATLTGVIGMAWAYYSYNTPSYFGDFTQKIHLIFAIGLALALCTIPTALVKAKRGIDLGNILLNIITGRIVIGAILIAFLYGLLIRPYIEPFAQFENPHYGTRNYQENTLLDLASYLSYPVIIFAVIALITSLRYIFERRQTTMLLVLIVWSGFTIIYLQDPRISPDHIWRIRRFTPIIIPGFILLSLLFVSAYIKKTKFDKITRTTLWIAAIAFIGYSSKPILGLRQYQGTFQVLEEINAAIPENALIISDITSRVYSGLHLWYGREIARGDLSIDEHKALLESLARRATETGKQTYLLSKRKLVNDTDEFQTKHWLLQYPALKGTYRAPARSTAVARFDIYLAQIHDGIRPFTGRESKIILGNAMMIGVEEEGLFGVETHGPNTYRWTNGKARIVIDQTFQQPLVHGTLSVAAARDEGSQTQVILNGETVLDTFVPRNGGSFTFTAPVHLLKERTISVEIVSETFNPHARNAASADKRTLGIKLSGLSLRADSEPSFGNVSIGARAIEGIVDSGLYEPERDANGLHRWTNGEATYRFTKKARFSPSRLKLSLSKSILPKTNFEILWNNRSIYVGQATPRQKEFVVPLDDIANSKDVELTIMSDAATPKELGINEDTRRLGLRIKAVEISGVYPK